MCVWLPSCYPTIKLPAHPTNELSGLNLHPRECKVNLLPTKPLRPVFWFSLMLSFLWERCSSITDRYITYTYCCLLGQKAKKKKSAVLFPVRHEVQRLFHRCLHVSSLENFCLSTRLLPTLHLLFWVPLAWCESWCSSSSHRKWNLQFKGAMYHPRWGEISALDKFYEMIAIQESSTAAVVEVRKVLHSFLACCITDTDVEFHLVMEMSSCTVLSGNSQWI